MSISLSSSRLLPKLFLSSLNLTLIGPRIHPTLPFTGRFFEKPCCIDRGGGWVGSGGDACVARVLVLARHTRHRRATQASPPLIHSTPAPTRFPGTFPFPKNLLVKGKPHPYPIRNRASPPVPVSL